jgi:peptidoglycan/xylan/chitin deacetylase (PgdA/CDA1 family)
MITRLISLAASRVCPVRNPIRAGRHCPPRYAVLCYRGVTDAQASRFQQQMEWLADNMDVVSTATCRRTEKAGCRSRGTVAITFDAAFENLERNVIPLLRRMRIPVTLFAVSENLGRKPKWAMSRRHPEAEEMLMAEGPLAALPRDLFEIGSLTATHRNLARLSRGEIRAELANSKNDLELSLGRAVTALSVPDGQWTPEVLEVAQEVGYTQVFTCDPVVAEIGPDNLAVGRFNVTPDDWMGEFALKARGTYRAMVRHRRFPRIEPPAKPKAAKSVRERKTVPA